MAMNRIQFQPGMSLFELFQQFGPFVNNRK
jgi:hypothetical protein